MYLEARDLQFTRGNFKLDGITFSAGDGTVTGIGGQNGSGKSTLLRLLFGYYRAEKGEVLVNGRNIAHLAAREVSRMISVVSQDVSEPFNFTVGDIVSMSGYSISGKKAPVEDVLDLCGIPELRYRPFTEVSGGEKRLAIIAAAIFQDADILLMDEPTAFLDVDKEMKVIEIIRNLKSRGRNVIVVLHDVNLLYRICDQVILLKRGKIMALGPREEVMTKENLSRTYSVDFADIENGGPYRFAPKNMMQLR